MRERGDMTFSMAEHRRRLDALRARMAERRLDAVIISDPENLAYLTEYQTTGYSYFQSLVVPAVDEPFMVTRRLEATNVEARTWVERVYPYPDSGDAIETLRLALEEHGLNRAILGYERGSYFLPAHFQDRLRLALADARLIDCFGIVEVGRIVKSEEELVMMERAAAAAQAGMSAGLAAIRPGISENDVAAEVAAAMFRAGGEYPAVMPYITSGPRTMIGHATWEGREIRKGECVFLEVGGCMKRYHAALMRTCFVGEPDEQIRQASDTVLEAMQVSLDKIKPGMRLGEVDAISRKIIRKAAPDFGGKQTSRCAYSIGIGFPPDWGEGHIMSIRHEDPRVLMPNTTFHFLPWVQIPGRGGIGFSETIRVTEDGCETLTNFPRELVLR